MQLPANRVNGPARAPAPPATNRVHTIVIGSGSGGSTVAIGLSALGKRVAVVEAHHVGGDCTNVGCVPSKALIHAAAQAQAGPAAAILAAVRDKRDRLRDEETVHLQQTANLSLVFGRASFEDRHQVLVTAADGGQRRLWGQHIVVATGSRPRPLAIDGLPPERLLTNETLFELPDAPGHLVVVGSGSVAMEMAFAFRRLGSRVTLLTRGARVLTKADPEASAVLLEALQARGIAVHTHARPVRYDAASAGLEIASRDARWRLDAVDRVLVALGRLPNLEELALERAGVRAEPGRGIPTDAYGRTNVPHIYAIGDVTPTSNFTHSANAQGRRVVQRIALPWLPARSAEPIYPQATFSEPEVASIGLSAAEIARRYHPGLVRRLRVELSELDRGYTDDIKQGFVLIDAMRLTGRILGATIVGPHAGDMLPVLALAHSRRISLYGLYQLVFAYPTLAEGIKRAADSYVRATLPHLPRELLAYLRLRWLPPPAARRPADAAVPTGASAS